MITGWSGFIFAFVAFFVSHSVPVRPPVKPWFVARLGARGFTATYSILSLAMLGWLIVAARNAPYVPLWLWSPWQAYIALIVMLLVCVILCFSFAVPNPFSFGGTRNDAFDPTQPGIVRWTRHPLLVTLALWAGSHLLANGDLAHVILFGLFAGFVLLGGRMVDRRRQREIGEDWFTLQQKMHRSARFRWTLSRAAVIRLSAAIVLYITLLLLHPVVLGVSPLP